MDLSEGYFRFCEIVRMELRTEAHIAVRASAPLD